MRAEEFPDMNQIGFEMMIAPSKLADVVIKEMSIIEYEYDPAIISYENTIVHAVLAISKGVKANFEECLLGLSKELQEELLATNEYLMSNKDLKIKRKIEGNHKGCKINYVSNIGFSGKRAKWGRRIIIP